MPAQVAHAPGLSKPKSKLRLRLGLGGDASPKLVRPTPVQEPRSAASSASYQASASSHLTTTTRNAPTESLGASANTTWSDLSRLSRGDSRSAFGLEISPSTVSHRSPTLAIDTVSYTTSSPRSSAFDSRLDSTSTLLLNDEHRSDQSTASPPSPSRSLQYLPDRFAEEYKNEEALKDPEEDESEDERDIIAVNRMQLALGVDDIFLIRTDQLFDSFHFVKEVGFGNWGSVWQCVPKRTRSVNHHNVPLNLGKRAAAFGGYGAGGRVAVKLVHRRESKTSHARVSALWGEMKIIKSLRHEPHPSIINFEAFIITRKFAIVVMPYLKRLIPVCIQPDRAKIYFRQLASAIGYLHERGITHNDIKPSNVLLSYTDIPVLVDFGFATRWDMHSQSAFLSTISWGTPEYLEPRRACGVIHDERASDVWSLGITMFEILVGRTPFEEEGDDQGISTEAEYLVYWERSYKAEWLGPWSMPHDMQQLLRAMICPDPAYRITAMQAYHHPSLQPTDSNVIVTPHFVRAAAQYVSPPPVPKETTAANDERKRRAKKTDKSNKENRAPTPALGESIRQHTSMPMLREEAKKDKGKQTQEKTPSPKKKSIVIKSNHKLLAEPPKSKDDDPTPTKSHKPAQVLRIKELNQTGATAMPRTSGGEAKTLNRTTSTNAMASAFKAGETQRESAISTTSTSTVGPKSKEEAVLKTMRSLEGVPRVERVRSIDVLSTIKRPAPSPPRPKSLDSQLEHESRQNKEEQRRSLGIDRHLEALREESPAKESASEQKVRESSGQRTITSPPRSTPKKGVANGAPVASPPRPRINTRPTEVVRDGRAFPTGEPSSPLAAFRQRIVSMDKDKLERFRTVSGKLMASKPSDAAVNAATRAPGGTETAAAATDDRHDKFALWVKDVERMVEEARKALAEGRELSLPSVGLPEGPSLPKLSNTRPSARSFEALDTDAMFVPPLPTLTSEEEKNAKIQRRFGLSPEKSSAIPAHLRTSSVQVEPATPPKWMVEQEAEEKARTAKEAQVTFEDESMSQPQAAVVEKVEEKRSSMGKKDQVFVRKGPKKDRPTVSHVLKLFGTEKDKAPGRVNTPEPMSTMPLKSPGGGQTLRAAPSTPTLRQSTLRASKGLGRKSESNLRNFNTMPTLSNLMEPDTEAARPSPRRAVYEELLDSTPGVIRQGDGWSSWGSSAGKAMAKTTSMVSLRERALAFLHNEHRESKEYKEVQRDSVRVSRDMAVIGAVGSSGGNGGVRDRHIVDLAKEVDLQREAARRSKQEFERPITPGMNAVSAKVERKGIFGKLKGIMGRKGPERSDE